MLVASFIFKKSPSAKIMWMLTLFCHLFSSGSVRHGVCMCIQQIHSLLQFWTLCVNCKYVSWEWGNLERMRSLCILNPPYASLLPYSPQEKHFRKGYFIIYIPIVKTGKWSTDIVWGMTCSFQWKEKTVWDTTGWKTNLRFIKSTVFKGMRSEIRTKENVLIMYFFYYHP